VSGKRSEAQNSRYRRFAAGVGRRLRDRATKADSAELQAARKVKKKRRNQPDFSIREQAFRICGVDLTQIHGIELIDTSRRHWVLLGSSHSITASYNGDSTYAASTSSALSQTVNQAATTTSVGSSANPSAYGQTVTVTATISSTTASSSSATGIVSFYDKNHCPAVTMK